MSSSSIQIQSLIALSTAIVISIVAVAARRHFHNQLAQAIDAVLIAFVLTPLFSKMFLLLLLPGVELSALPLHVCDVAGAFCALAIATRHPEVATLGLLTAVLYSSVAICQPDLGIGPTPVELALFWTRHISLLVASIYLIFGLGLLPTRRGYWQWVAFVVAYVALIVPLNNLLNTNFAYMSDMKDVPRILDELGAWPNRLLPMVAIPLLLGAALTELSVRWTKNRTRR